MKHIMLIFFILLSSVFKESSNAKDTRLEGPILAGKTSALSTEIAFQDIETGDVWTYSVGASPTQSLNIIGWSPNGCKLLIRTLEGFFVLPISDYSIEEMLDTSIPLSSSVIWYPSNESIIFTFEEGEITTVYLLDLETHSKRRLFSKPGSIQLYEWLSTHDLLYRYNHEFFVRNNETQQSYPFDFEKHPAYASHLRALDLSMEQLFPRSEWHSYLYVTEMSPDRQKMAAYFSERRYYEAKYETEMDNFDDFESVLPVPGLAIHSYESEVTQYIDINGFYIWSLEWSPDSRRVAVTTTRDYIFKSEHTGLFGIYIYDLEKEHTQRIDKAFGWLWGFSPTWSSDSNWLTIDLIEGRAIYNLANDEVIPLDKLFNNTPKVFWSPVMDYSEALCSASE